ncbi:MAG: DUF3800 domain-containing protein [Solirubrobacterales bacterium]
MNLRKIATEPTVHIYFDESGDFSFAPGDFRCHSLAALICPDSVVPEIERFVADRTKKWGVDELHATDLDPAQLFSIAHFILSSDCQLLGFVTDNVLVTPSSIQQYRLAQAARAKDNMERYRRESTYLRGAPVEEIIGWYDRQIKRAATPSKISDSEFVQAQFMVELIYRALQKSVDFYPDNRWREDFNDFRFIVDGRLTNKRAAGEKYLEESIRLIYGSGQFGALGTPEAWRGDEQHPFNRRFGGMNGVFAGRKVEDGISIGAIFEHGIQFEDSAAHAGVQLADAAAYLIRRAVLEPDETAVRNAYEAIRPKLANEAGATLSIKRLSGGGSESSLDRYRELV